MTTEEMLRLKSTYLAPYMQLGTALIGKARDSGSNMWRHQMDTLATLIDYNYIIPVLLKASVVHDVIEDIPDFNRNLLINLDADGPAVYDLVLEVSRLKGRETKGEFLTRVREHGSRNAKVLKCADRISNMVSLGYVNNPGFINRYCDETENFIYPIAEEVDRAMLMELRHLVDSRRRFVQVLKLCPENKLDEIYEAEGGPKKKS
jgi:(p)ppGpp synthase/HD superfamily hydrolase